MSGLSDVINKMNKTAQGEVVTVGLPSYDFKRIPFTSPRMNYCTFGGLPVGQLIEFYGEEHGGKTTTALDIIANYQQIEDARKVLYIDAENTLDTKWAVKLGVNVDDMIVFKPTSQSAEEIFQFILDAIESDEVGLWVLDSIPALSSAQELEKDLTEKTYAGISGALSVFSRKVEKANHQHHCTGIGINQLRDDLGAMWGGAVKTPGGRAWKHFCAVRLQFSKGKYIDEKGNELTRSVESPAGNYVVMSMTKNKSCPPTRRTGFYTLNYEYGIDYLKDLVEVAMKYGLIDKSGAWFSIINPETGEQIVKLQGQNKVNEYLEDEENEPVLKLIEDYIDEKPHFIIKSGTGFTFERKDINSSRFRIYVDKLGNNKPCFYLKSILWDDYGHKTSFDLQYIDQEGNYSSVGRVKICKKNENKTIDVIPKSFTSLNFDYCSLGQDTSYYSKIKRILGDDTMVFLYAMKDAAAYSRISDDFENDLGFRHSLLRDNSVQVPQVPNLPVLIDRFQQND